MGNTKTLPSEVMSAAVIAALKAMGHSIEVEKWTNRISIDGVSPRYEVRDQRGYGFRCEPTGKVTVTIGWKSSGLRRFGPKEPAALSATAIAEALVVEAKRVKAENQEDDMRMSERKATERWANEALDVCGRPGKSQFRVVSDNPQLVSFTLFDLDRAKFTAVVQLLKQSGLF